MVHAVFSLMTTIRSVGIKDKLQGRAEARFLNVCFLTCSINLPWGVVRNVNLGLYHLPSESGSQELGPNNLHLSFNKS